MVMFDVINFLEIDSFSMAMWFDANTWNQKRKLVLHFHIIVKKMNFSTSPQIFIISGKVGGKYSLFSKHYQF